MEAFSKFIAIILVAIALFVVPVVHMGEQKDAITQSYVSERVTAFVEDVKKQGRITQGMYDKFLADLDDTNVVYDISMTHTHTEVSPTFTKDGSVEEVKEYDMCYYTEEILDGIYSHEADTNAGEVNGEYRLSKGDYFTMTVTNKHSTLATKIRSRVFETEFPKTSIYVIYGGRIQDENY